MNKMEKKLNSGFSEKEAKDLEKSLFEPETSEEVESRMKQEGWAKIPDEEVKKIREEHFRNVGADIQKSIIAREESLYRSKDSSIKYY